MGWYYRGEGKNEVFGPIEENGEGRVLGLDEVIAEGFIGPDTYVSEGDSNWRPANETDLANRSAAREWGTRPHPQHGDSKHTADVRPSWKKDLELVEDEKLIYECATDNMWVTNLRVQRHMHSILVKDIQSVNTETLPIAEHQNFFIHLILKKRTWLDGWEELMRGIFLARLWDNLGRWWNALIYRRPYLSAQDDLWTYVSVKTAATEMIVFYCPGPPPAYPSSLREKWEKLYVKEKDQHHEVDAIVDAVNRARATAVNTG